MSYEYVGDSHNDGLETFLLDKPDHAFSTENLNLALTD